MLWMVCTTTIYSILGYFGLLLQAHGTMQIVVDIVTRIYLIELITDPERSGVACLYGMRSAVKWRVVIITASVVRGARKGKPEVTINTGFIWSDKVSAYAGIFRKRICTRDLMVLWPIHQILVLGGPLTELAGTIPAEGKSNNDNTLYPEMAKHQANTMWRPGVPKQDWTHGLLPVHKAIMLKILTYRCNVEQYGGT